MNHILVAFAGEKTRQRMTDICESTGIRVSAACSSGAEVLRWCGRMSGGVVLCGFRLMDMMADELFENLPKGFSMYPAPDFYKLFHLAGTHTDI